MASVYGFKDQNGSIRRYDYNSLDNAPILVFSTLYNAATNTITTTKPSSEIIQAAFGGAPRVYLYTDFGLAKCNYCEMHYEPPIESSDGPTSGAGQTTYNLAFSCFANNIYGEYPYPVGYLTIIFNVDAADVSDSNQMSGTVTFSDLMNIAVFNTIDGIRANTVKTVDSGEDLIAASLDNSKTVYLNTKYGLIKQTGFVMNCPEPYTTTYYTLTFASLSNKPSAEDDGKVGYVKVIFENVLNSSDTIQGTLSFNDFASEVQVDSELSSSSTNPVQNKVVDGAIDELKSDLNNCTPVSAEIDDESIVSFKNRNGIVLFTLDLSDIGVSYSNLVVSKESIEISENGTDTFTVKLDAQPDRNQPVYIAVSDPSKITALPAALTFTTENWNVPQTVTIEALSDSDSDDETESVVISSRKVSSKTLEVTVADTTPGKVTDGLQLEFDFRNLDENATTVIDTVSGVTLANLITSDFHRLENGIYGSSNYKYASLVTNDEAFSSFKNSMISADTTGFTVEIFGTKIPTCLNTGTAKVFGTNLASGYYAGVDRNIGMNTQMPYLDTNGEKQKYTSSDLYPLNAKNETYLQADLVCNSDGTINIIVNGNLCQWSVSDFGSWDLGTMLTPTNQYYLGSWQIGDNANNYLTFIRYYNRPLSENDIVKNTEYNKFSLGISNF